MFGPLVRLLRRNDPVRLPRALAREVARSPEWPRVRDQHLKAHPTCAVCGGTEQLQVHHIYPFHLFPARELDPSNLVTLCEHPSHDCHYVFGHYHNWLRYNPEVVAMAADYFAKQQKAP